MQGRKDITFPAWPTSSGDEGSQGGGDLPLRPQDQLRRPLVQAHGRAARLRL